MTKIREAVRPTRYDELGYVCDGPGLWRFVDKTDGPLPSSNFYPRVGPQYKTRAELLADLERYAAFFGCAAATPEPVSEGRQRCIEVLDALAKNFAERAQGPNQSVYTFMFTEQELLALRDACTEEKHRLLGSNKQ